MTQEQYECLEELENDYEYQQWLVEGSNDGVVIDSSDSMGGSTCGL